MINYVINFDLAVFFQAGLIDRYLLIHTKHIKRKRDEVVHANYKNVGHV